MADLLLTLNLAQQILAARRVLSATDLLTLDLPPFQAGSTYSAELKLADGAGDYDARSGTAGYEPRLLISYVDDAGERIVLVQVGADAFTPITDGWSFDLPLTTSALLTYLGATGDPKLATVELNLTDPDGHVLPLFLREASFIPRAYDPSTPDPESGESTPFLVIRPDLTGLGISAPGATKLSGLAASVLQGWADGKTLRLQLAGEISADYRLVTGAVGTESQWRVACDNAAGRYWALAANPSKQGAPTVWAASLSKFKQVLDAGGTLALADDADAFVLPD